MSFPRFYSKHTRGSRTHTFHKTLLKAGFKRYIIYGSFPSTVMLGHATIIRAWSQSGVTHLKDYCRVRWVTPLSGSKPFFLSLVMYTQNASLHLLSIQVLSWWPGEGRRLWWPLTQSRLQGSCPSSGYSCTATQSCSSAARTSSQLTLPRHPVSSAIHSVCPLCT